MHSNTGIPLDACTALLIRIQRGDEGAFAELYEREHQVLFLLLFKQLGGRESTEALLRELFTGVWSDSQRFDPELSSGRAWLCSLARDMVARDMVARDLLAREQVVPESLKPSTVSVVVSSRDPLVLGDSKDADLHHS